ncbi:cobyrinate a,c-diamide synthase [Nocardioides sp. CN2-186]
MSLTRVVIAAPSTGQGKTTIATGLMAALRSAGNEVSPHKVGPDYIDPGYHALATGRPGRNLDPHLVGEERIVPLLLHGARGADVAVIEGVMGLYDGRLGTDGFASTAHVATLTRTPVVLVLDVARLSRTAGAIAAGMVAYDAAVEIAGVVLNRAGSERNTAEIVRSLERTGLPVLGVLPHDDRLAAPSRHLGLVPVAERDGSVRSIADLGEQVAQHLDLAAILDVARSAPDLDAEPWTPALVPPSDSRPVVAMAGGRAFTFRYPETEELLASAGCRVVTFDPLSDAALPAGTRGIYLGGGFPEMYAAELAANTGLLRDLRAAVAAGVPTVAECAGLLLLAESLDGVPMAGAVPAVAAMAERLTLRYPEVTPTADSLLMRAGEPVTGHEFHRTRTTPDRDFTSATLHASYLHVHWAGHPQLAQRFAEAVHGGQLDPLRHHGDAEATTGLLDLAVNVFDGPRPAWLDAALHAAVDDASAYPDAAPAAAAIAAHHGRSLAEVLPTAGAAEAFTLVARLRDWRRPVVVHPQFTEPHAALEQAGHAVTSVLCRPEDGFSLDPGAVPEDADLVVVGNPTNPTGVLHPAAAIRRLCRDGRLVVVDEAFMDAVPGQPESLAGEPGVLVVRSLTKHWSIPGIRAGYVVGDPDVVAALRRQQTPWSLSAPAIAATVACLSAEAAPESAARADTIAAWRTVLEDALRSRGIEHVPSASSFVLARVGHGVHATLRDRGIAVRRADTFPGLDGSWVRIAVRPPESTARLLSALTS